MDCGQTALEQGVYATFMPKPTAGEVGSSCHVHLSVRDPQGARPFYDAEAHDHMSPMMRHAIGGVLEHAAPLMAWYAPTINSYRRTNSGDFAGHGATWGYDNRTVSCRVLGDHPNSLRFEWRVPGADVNPYLAVAGVIASLRAGVADGIDPGPARTGDAYQQDTRPFPKHLGLAADEFAASPFVTATFGPTVVEQYSLTAQYEWSQFMDAVTDWELDRYFEVI